MQLIDAIKEISSSLSPYSENIRQQGPGGEAKWLASTSRAKTQSDIPIPFTVKVKNQIWSNAKKAVGISKKPLERELGLKSQIGISSLFALAGAGVAILIARQLTRKNP